MGWQSYPTEIKISIYLSITLRNSVAAMESDFVSFKMEILQSFDSLESTVTSNNGEMKDKLTQLDNNSKLRIKNLEEENKELSVSNGKLMEVSKVSLAMKKLQDQISSMHKENSNKRWQTQKNPPYNKMEISNNNNKNRKRWLTGLINSRLINSTLKPQRTGYKTMTKQLLWCCATPMANI